MKILMTILSGLFALSTLAGQGAFATETTADTPPLLPGYVTVNNANLHFVESGTGEKTIIFIHGFPEFWYMWKSQLKEFSKDYHVVAPDLRGYNLSQKFPNKQDYSIDTVMGDIEGLIKHFAKDKKAILVAHDWGAALSYIFASRYPDLVEKLIIINGPHLNVFLNEYRNNPEQKKASGYIPMFRADGSEKVLSDNTYGVLRKNIFAAFPKAFSPDDQTAYLDAWAVEGALSGGLNYYRAFSPLDVGSTEEVKPHHLVVPTLVIWGELDHTLVYQNVTGLKKYYPPQDDPRYGNLLEVHPVSGVGHWIVQEKPDLINEILREYLSRTP